MDELRLLLLLLVANGSPIAARVVLGERLDRPLDGARCLADGRRILGDSKTWRGVFAAVALTALCAPLLGQSWTVGATIGSFAMLGDALSSFVKRRMGMPSGTMAPGLDHLPESILPLLAIKSPLGLSWPQIGILGIAFMLADLLLSRVLYRLGIRRHPH